MKSKNNALALISMVVFLVIAYFFNAATDTLKKYVEETFDFPSAQAAQLGMALVFGFMVVAIVFVLLANRMPDRWVFGVALAISLVSPLVFFFQWVARADFVGIIPARIRFALAPFPVSYLGISMLILFWIAVAGLWLKRSGRAPKGQ